ncbi:MAG: DUF4125 family protein [Lachnospiraceae bacterium]
MDANIFLRQLDEYFTVQNIEAVEPFITNELKLAYQREDYNLCITILNEGIGFFRDTSQTEKSLGYCAKLLELFRMLGMEGSIGHATSLLNVANALRAANKLDTSLAFHKKVEEVYEQKLPRGDERFASLYNNMSLLYQEMGDFTAAVASLLKALVIIEQIGDVIKIAITHSNLGSSLLNLGNLDEAKGHIQIALDIFHEDGDVDFHYGAAVAAMAQAYTMEEAYEQARESYYIALLEQYKHCGKTDFFYRLLDNLHVVEDRMGVERSLEPTEATLEEYLSPQIEPACEVDSEIVIEEELVEKIDVSPVQVQPGAVALTGMQISKLFFEKSYPLFLEHFSDIVPHIAFGLIGEGSECLGFDDVYSTDHDFGPGFCIWMPHELYEQFGAQVQSLYDSLPDTFMGYTRTVVNGAHRVGVHDRNAFFTYFTGYASCVEFHEVVADYPDIDAMAFLQECKEESLACLFSGEIFRDESLVFTTQRDDLLKLFTVEYPEYFLVKTSESLSKLAQYGQYNYIRCMKRSDFITAQLTLHKFMEESLKLAHYMNSKFPPYYKWLVKSTSKLDELPILANLIEAFVDHGDQRSVWSAYYEASDALPQVLAEDKVIGIIEYIAKLFIYEATRMKLADFSSLSPGETYLDAYATCIVQTIRTKEELVDELVALEWIAFDQVQNEGGRADCQDDLATFTIMRKSQYLTWNIRMLKSYIADFKSANESGLNLITEKYGRMMSSTDPDRYEEISKFFTELTAKQISLIEQVVAIQVRWMESFALEYPKMAGNSRSIHTYEDTVFNTSYETYLRGELGTYSDETLKLYASFIISLAKDGKNLAELTMEHTARLYGYESLKDAEYKI